MKKAPPFALWAVPLAAVCLTLFPAAAQAHVIGGGTADGFLSGLAHPVLGLDHFLAMVSVGLLSAQIGGKAIWTVPTTFVLVMLVGGILGMAGAPFVAVELGIAFSVFTLGVALAADKNVPVVSSMIFVGIFAIFHGYAHGAEMPIVSKPALYALGFVTGTTGIHLLGVALGLTVEKVPKGSWLLRAAGAGIAMVGLHMLAT